MNRNDDTLVLFPYDWDALGCDRQGVPRPNRVGFDLHRFPANLRLAAFDIDRFTAGLARRADRAGWRGVTSGHEQFGALAAARLAERMGWAGPPVRAVLACQHKLHARRVLAEVAPEANPDTFGLVDMPYNGTVPADVPYPAFVRPIKAAFSVLATEVRDAADLHRHTRFGPLERVIIRRLVEPFHRLQRRVLPEADNPHRLYYETPVGGAQYNLDGYVHDGTVHALGVVDAHMYPGTNAFQRFEYPSRLPAAVQRRAFDVARRFLAAIGFDHGLFNMEFFYDPASDRLTVIEFNPRLAAQFADLYRRVDGVDPHAIALALARGRDPATLSRATPTARVAASFVYRAFSADTVPPPPSRDARQRLHELDPDSLFLAFPKRGRALEREFRWLNSHRYGVLHLGAASRETLLRACARASLQLGWPAPLPPDEAGQEAPHPTLPPTERPAFEGA